MVDRLRTPVIELFRSNQWKLRIDTFIPELGKAIFISGTLRLCVSFLIALAAAASLRGRS